MDKKGTQDPDNDEITGSRKKLDPKEGKNFRNRIKEVLTAPEFVDFMNEKLRSEPDQIENPDKILGDKLLPYFKEFREAKSESYSKKPDFKQMENSQWISLEQIVVYFDKLTKERTEETSNLTPEDINTLKQFLKDKYLSAKDVERILKGTDFKAAYNHVNDRVHKLHNLCLLKKTEPSGNAFISKFDKRSQCYKLTSYGLFCTLKEIQEIDVGDPIIDVPSGIRIFEVYQNDPLLQLFLHDLIDMNLLSKIMEFQIKWPFARYLKQACQEIHKELEFFAEFQKNGMTVEFEVKWNRNLLNKKAEWNRFFDDLIWYIIPHHVFDFQMLNLSKLIVKLNVTKDSCSFYYGNKKYSIDIDTKNKKAIFRIDGQEYSKVYDKVYQKLFGKIDVQVKPHCFVLSSLSQESYVYQMYLLRRFNVPIRLLKTQLGYSILQLFKEDELLKYDKSSASSSKKYLTELRKLASDKKVKRLINEFYAEVNEDYQGFTKYNS